MKEPSIATPPHRTNERNAQYEIAIGLSKYPKIWIYKKEMRNKNGGIHEERIPSHVKKIRRFREEWPIRSIQKAITNYYGNPFYIYPNSKAKMEGPYPSLTKLEPVAINTSGKYCTKAIHTGVK